jgi:Spy/CpxP family protein refolding chaperone
MKTLSALVTLGLAIAVGSLVGAANAAKQEPNKPRAAVLIVAIQDLDLTDAQEAKIMDLRKTFQPKVQEAAKDLETFAKDEVEKIRDVLTPEQRQKLQAMKEDRKDQREECLAHRVANLKEVDLTDDEMAKIGEIRKEFRPKAEKAAQELHGLLTDEQKKAREEALRAGKSRREVLTSLNLTNEQKEKVATVGKQLKDLCREETEKVREVLSASQQEKLQDLAAERKEHVRDRMAHRIANSQDLNLTGEQKARITAIRQEFRPKIHDAGNKLRATIREEVEGIEAVIKG